MNDTALLMFDKKRAMRKYVGILYDLARWSSRGIILEIGTGTGFQSTRTFLGAISDREDGGKLVSIDISRKKDRVPDNLKPYWELVIGDSHLQSTLDLVSNKTYDMILIDGDHTTEGVRADVDMYSKLLVPGGLMVLHDVLNRCPNGGVRAYWEDMITSERLTIPTWPGLGIFRPTA